MWLYRLLGLVPGTSIVASSEASHLITQIFTDGVVHKTSCPRYTRTNSNRESCISTLLVATLFDLLENCHCPRPVTPSFTMEPIPSTYGADASVSHGMTSHAASTMSTGGCNAIFLGDGRASWLCQGGPAGTLIAAYQLHISRRGTKLNSHPQTHQRTWCSHQLSSFGLISLHT